VTNVIQGWEPGCNHIGAEKNSIRMFLEEMAPKYAKGKLLDVGGRDKQYEEIFKPYVELHYCNDPHSKDVEFPGNIESYRGCGLKFDTLLCTQVVQYFKEPSVALAAMYDLLTPDGFLIMTGPTNWGIVQSEDLFRFTESGIQELLSQIDFEVVECKRRIGFISGLTGMKNESLDQLVPLGWGIVAKKG
jgi:SAM-dependent methyltransferase